MLLAVNLGEDADTTGAVYRQLAGAYYGEEGIPRSWRRKLAHRLLIEHFAEKLFHLGRTVDWSRLLAFLPSFERPDMVFIRGYMVNAPEVEEFHQRLYDDGVLFPFDCESWSLEAKRLMEDSTAVAAADEATLRKLLYYHVRANHHNGEHIGEMFEGGHMTALLRRLEELQGGA